MNSIVSALSLNLSKTTSSDAYEQWSLQYRLSQIRYMNFFTALLYFLYAYFEYLMDLPYAELRLGTHGFLIPAFLLIIHRLTYNPSYHKHMRLLLTIAPVLAVWINLFLNAGTPMFADFVPEIYLNIIWTFIMSGLTLRYALYAVSLSLLGTLILAGQHWSSDPTLYLHSLWLISSCVFGIVNALVLERMMRSIYDQQLQLEYSASIDLLTGLCNRYKLLRFFEQQEQLYSDKQNFSVLMIDIDHFKLVNDEFGHIAGDKVLIQFADLIKQHIGQNGHVGRFGGEEFCVLLPDKDQQQAFEIAEALLENIRGYSFSLVGDKTASIGVCQYQHNETFERFISRADQALYKAKSNGRNQVQS